jgi:hypothetical protein
LAQTLGLMDIEILQMSQLSTQGSKY